MTGKNTSKSAGGNARSESLTPQRRSQIAKKAAQSRWSGQTAIQPEGILTAAYGAPDQLLKIGDVDVECYVLEDGKRVLSGRGMQQAIGFGGAASSHGSKLRTFVQHKAIKPYVNKDLAMAFDDPVRFVRPGRGGKPAIAFEATLLIDLCDTILQVSKRNDAPKSIMKAAIQAQMIVLSFAKGGIVAAVDEVTGYQAVREKDAIQKIVNKYLTDYKQKWTKKFPDEFWEKLLTAKGYESYIGLNRPSFVGHWINDIVYSRMAPGVLKKLKELNPSQAGKKGRKFKHTQFLTEDHGVPELQQHLIKLMTLMDFSISSGQNFDLVLNQTIPKHGDLFANEC